MPPRKGKRKGKCKKTKKATALEKHMNEIRRRKEKQMAEESMLGDGPVDFGFFYFRQHDPKAAQRKYTTCLFSEVIKEEVQDEAEASNQDGTPQEELYDASTDEMSKTDADLQKKIELEAAETARSKAQNEKLQASQALDLRKVVEEMKKKRADEEKRRLDENKRIEEERKRTEEIQRIERERKRVQEENERREEERRLEEESKRREEEMRRLEEQKRIEEENKLIENEKKAEDEKKLLEEERVRRKLEEENRRAEKLVEKTRAEELRQRTKVEVDQQLRCIGKTLKDRRNKRDMAMDTSDGGPVERPDPAHERLVDSFLDGVFSLMRLQNTEDDLDSPIEEPDPEGGDIEWSDDLIQDIFKSKHMQLQPYIKTPNVMFNISERYDKWLFPLWNDDALRKTLSAARNGDVDLLKTEFIAECRIPGGFQYTRPVRQKANPLNIAIAYRQVECVNLLLNLKSLKKELDPEVYAQWKLTLFKWRDSSQHISPHLVLGMNPVLFGCTDSKDMKILEILIKMEFRVSFHVLWRYSGYSYIVDTPWYHAAVGGDMTLVSYYCENFDNLDVFTCVVDARYQCTFVYSALQGAVRSGNLKNAQILQTMFERRRQDLDKRREIRFFPLKDFDNMLRWYPKMDESVGRIAEVEDVMQIAAECGHKDILLSFILRIPHPEDFPFSYNAACILVTNRNLPLLKELHERGDGIVHRGFAKIHELTHIYINMTCINDTALSLAAYMGQVDIIDYLVGRGAYIHRCFPMERAVQGGNMLAIQAFLIKYWHLMQMDEDMNAVHINRALVAAIEKNNVEIIEELVKRGGNLKFDPHEMNRERPRIPYVTAHHMLHERKRHSSRERTAGSNA